MRRFKFNAADRISDVITFDQRESRHISRVLRLRCGERVELFDGSATIFEGEIIALGTMVTARILSHREVKPEQRGEIRLGQGIIKAKNMEMLLQKCTELGVAAFVPFVSSRSQGNLVAQMKGKDNRWRRIIEESCKQCSRPQPMLLGAVQAFEEAIIPQAEEEGVVKLLLWEKEREKSLADLSAEIGRCHGVRLLLGPEGGFADDEISAARSRGWQTAGLGPRILRSETAAIAATAIIQHLLGNMQCVRP